MCESKAPRLHVNRVRYRAYLYVVIRRIRKYDRPSIGNQCHILVYLFNASIVGTYCGGKLHVIRFIGMNLLLVVMMTAGWFDW